MGQHLSEILRCCTQFLRPSPLTDEDWPLISAGLTPLEGTMYTATDYFLNRTGYFGSNQGNDGSDLPNINNAEASQCLVNANIWLTDGLPSVNRFGSPLGSNVEQALEDAEEAIQRLYNETEDSSRFNDPVKTYVVGFSLPPDVANLFGDGENPLDALAAAGGTERAYLASDEASLNDVMQQVFGNIIAGAQSNTSAASNVSELSASSDAFLYTAGFSSEDWSGRLTAYKISADGSLTDGWSAEEALKDQIGERTLLTSIVSENEEGKRLTQGASLNAENTELSENEIRWLQGNEIEGLRNRKNLLGDIINSNPRVIPAKGERVGVVLVGANDGMLHGFDAATGEELFAYMPSEHTTGSEPVIRTLMQPEYNHRFLMDGETTVKEVSIDGEKRVIAVGTMGAGGRSVFALDITNPATMTTDDVLWEYRHPELGTGVNRAIITQLHNGKWAAIFGNGYNSVGYEASLFVVDLESGASLVKNDEGKGHPIRTGVGSSRSPNGLAAPAVTPWPDFSNGSQRAYAGDLEGNMWRFDLEAMSVSALYEGSASQPISAAPALTLSDSRPETLMVLFGTGSYFRQGDTGNIPTQRLIGLQEAADNRSAIRSNKLTEQEVLLSTSSPETDFELRSTTNNLLGNNDKGWYLELDEQERVISTPVIATGGRRAFFSTLVPDESNPCAGGREGYLLNLLVDTGGSGQETLFDLDRDVEIDTDSKLAGNVISGVKMGTGESVKRVTDPDAGVDRLYVGDPTSDTAPDGGFISVGFEGGSSGRVSWRQLFEEAE